ncbi:hypothetical protein [Acetobacter senegalensis]|uniref:hypothetical protein n=1 Tax=Acetobacter senegalensis TaxID=446692 RepID=UPI001ED9EA44|nr:hypothetical protein [Acetobacter senegalensis]MCG4258654.1 hypothetical protein [Acetobacter senegalensis]MCG4260897.1 hypothetical protein [Acetobacter senegalensis]MCG4268537.1 hypothetical protein [Acetobacter senegalensis]
MNRSHVGVATSSGWTVTRHYPLSVLAVVRKLAILVSGPKAVMNVSVFSVTVRLFAMVC